MFLFHAVTHPLCLRALSVWAVVWSIDLTCWERLCFTSWWRLLLELRLYLLYLLLQRRPLLLLGQRRVRERLLRERGGGAVSLRQGGGAQRHGLHVQRWHQLHGRVRVHGLRLSGGSRLERLQEAVHLAEGRGFSTGGCRLFVVLEQGLGGLCREGAQDAVWRGWGDTRTGDRLGKRQGKRRLELGWWGRGQGGERGRGRLRGLGGKRCCPVARSRWLLGQSIVDRYKAGREQSDGKSSEKQLSSLKRHSQKVTVPKTPLTM